MRPVLAGAGRRVGRCPQDGRRERTAVMHRGLSIGSGDPPIVLRRQCALDRALSLHRHRGGARRAPGRSRVPTSATGTTFWVPAGRSRSWTSPSASSSPTMTAKCACSLAADSSCLPSLSPTQLRARRDPGCPQVRGDPQACDRVIGIGAHHDDRRWRVRGDLPALLAEREEEPVQADPETDPRRRPPTKKLDEAVVAATAADRLLLALSAGDVELEGGSRVVVETADEPRFEPVWHTERFEMGSDARRSARRRPRRDGR